METQKQAHEIIENLALIYIALAHATDHELSDAEVNAIAERLRGWQKGPSKTPLSALKEALDDYVQQEATDRLDAAIETIRASIPQEQRQQILDDLTEIAMADDKFTHRESAFIGQLSRAWDVHPSDVPALDTLWWSVLDNGNTSGGWTALHHLALIYVSLAHETDDDLSTREIEAITEKLSEWVPDAPEDDMLTVVQEVLAAYVQGQDKRLFSDSVDALKTAVPEHQRTALLADLRFIADADGVLLDAEQKMIERLSHAWQIPIGA
ncbi:MAG TPA: TerB family tellurite resistance protein [Rhodothermales bacterium]|nr:TerB family tellurite resistance protein [Rhodothermales bacterium]